MSNPREIHITLIGKTGVGKSAVGNTILGMNRFPVGSGSSSVTRRCQTESAVVTDRTVTVLDTPDFFHSTHEDDLISEIDRSVKLSPHAFLYVLKPVTFTKQEAETVSKFTQTYGEEVLRHTVILFTHGDQLQRVKIDRLISQNQSLRDVVDRCGGRFTVLNNEAPTDTEQVHYLLQIIDHMVTANQNSCYTLEMLQEVQRRAEEQREMSLEKIKHQEDLERAERETEIRVRKEYEEDLKKRRVGEGDTSSSAGERDSDKVGQESRVKRWFVNQQKYILVVTVFSLSMGCLLISGSADRWTFVRGCGLGGSAAVLGVITGKVWGLIWRSQFGMSCSPPQQRPHVLYQYLKKALGVLCGGLVGSGVSFTGPHQTHVILLAALAGATGAYTAMHRRR